MFIIHGGFKMSKNNDIKDIPCCANCKHLVQTPKNNRYGDMENFCMVTGYFCIGIHKDVRNYRRFTPGGKELICRYEKKI